MPAVREGNAEQQEFLGELIEAGLALPSGVPGVWGWDGRFQAVFAGLDALITEAASEEGAITMRFPPVLPRAQLEANGYLATFPHLAGAIFAFEGDDAEALELQESAERGEGWADHVQQSALVLLPAACYPVYPAVARRSPLVPGGLTVDTGGAYVFRHEPSTDPARLQMFHQRELVRIAEPATVAAWRDTWRDRSLELLRGLGLEVEADVASDPFFGRGGRMMARSQRQQALKFEILASLRGPEPTAVASFNYHQDHFSGVHHIHLADGSVAHTACLGFGLERVTLALFARHGLDAGGWPDAVSERLGLSG